VRQPSSGGGGAHGTFPAADGCKDVPSARSRMAQKYKVTALQINVACRALASLFRPCQNPTAALFCQRAAHGLMRSLTTCPSTLISVFPACRVIGTVGKAMCQPQILLGAPSPQEKASRLPFFSGISASAVSLIRCFDADVG
jgi:hypothetical protein